MNVNTIEIAGRPVGPGHPCFVIAEAGVNHNGDLNVALQLIDAAAQAGADAVYFGLKQLNMRAKAKNFELRELKKLTDYCHKNNVKAYLTLNTIIYENELKDVKKFEGWLLELIDFLNLALKEKKGIEWSV